MDREICKRIEIQLAKEFFGEPVDHITEVKVRMRCRELLDLEGLDGVKFKVEFKVWNYLLSSWCVNFINSSSTSSSSISTSTSTKV
jgi:hypothetical protein